jgi:alpha-tubulin suppressor-like RCC1 family protein
MYSTSMCALDTSGTIYCWGTGALGHDNDYTTSAVPIKVDTTGTFIRLEHGGSSQGASTDCAVKSDHSVWCWGFNTFGDVGITTRSEVFKPVRAAVSAGNATFVDLSLGEDKACALTDTGNLWCWGMNITAQGEDAKLLGGSFAQVAVGFAGTMCGVKIDGTMWCWQNAAISGATQVPLACP